MLNIIRDIIIQFIFIIMSVRIFYNTDSVIRSPRTDFSGNFHITVLYVVGIPKNYCQTMELEINVPELIKIRYDVV